jgi:serine/threonine protein kinase/tetratricopeptide (TPR) repeat protein
MDTLTITAEPIDGYFESCYAAYLRGDPRPELPPGVEDALTPDDRGRIDEVVERLRRQAEARRGRPKRRGTRKASAGSSPDPFPKVPGYEITGLLDEGGFGRVYRAISRRHFGVPVALKILRQPFSPEAGPGAPEHRLLMTRLLIGEAQVLAHIGHRNVVRYLGSGIVESGPEAGTPFIATELIDGLSLARRIGQSPQDPRWSARILAQVADALDFVHQLKLQRPTDGDEEDPGPGILHRDVKPSNILLGRGDQPILTDFGLAGRVGRAASDEGFVAGTAAYSAPEQLRADAVLTPAVDVYGLGATLYHLLTGQPPRREPAPADRGGAKAGPRLISPRRLASRIPADLERICLKCLEDDPSRRYQTAGAVRDDLHQFLDGKPVSIHPVGPWGRAVRWARRSPLAATLAVSLVLALAIGLLTTAWLWRRAEAQYRSTLGDFNQVFFMASRSLGEDATLPIDYCVDRLQAARSFLVQTGEQRAGDAEIWRLLARVDLVIGRALERQGKLVEARSIYEESLPAWEKCLQADPGDKFAQHHRWECVLKLARIAEGEENADVSVRHWERAVTLGEALQPDMSGVELGALAECQTRLQRARDERLKPRDTVESEISDRPDQLLSAACALADKGDWDRARGVIHALATEKRPVRVDSPQRRQAVDQGLAQWFTREARHWGIVRRDKKVGREPLAHEADEIVDLLGQLGEALGFRDWPTHRAISGMTYELVDRAASQRRGGRLGLEEAKLTSAFLMELARRLVARYPNQAAAHWVLGHAYNQMHKNAWKTDDRAAVERYLKLAVDAAHRAAVLDPDNAVVRYHLTDWQERLRNLLSPPKSVSASESAARPGARN